MNKSGLVKKILNKYDYLELSKLKEIILKVMF